MLVFILLLPFFIAAIMPGWRSLLALSVVAGGPLVWWTADYLIASSSPNFNAGPGGALGFRMIKAATASLLFGIAARSISLFMSAGKTPKTLSLLPIVAGFALSLGYIFFLA